MTGSLILIGAIDIFFDRLFDRLFDRYPVKI